MERKWNRDVRLREHIVGKAIQHEGSHEVKVLGLESFSELLNYLEFWRHSWWVVFESGWRFGG